MDRSKGSNDVLFDFLSRTMTRFDFTGHCLILFKTFIGYCSILPQKIERFWVEVVKMFETCVDSMGRMMSASIKSTLIDFNKFFFG